MMEPTLQFHAPKMAVTIDEEQVYHMITDSQLSSLERQSRGDAFDLALVFVGAAIGLFKDFVAVLGKIHEAKPLETIDAVSASIFVFAVTAAISLFFSDRSKCHSVKEICKQIRARAPQRG